MEPITAIYLNTLFVVSYFGGIWFARVGDYAPMLICLIGAVVTGIFITVASWK